MAISKSITGALEVNPKIHHRPVVSRGSRFYLLVSFAQDPHRDFEVEIEFFPIREDEDNNFLSLQHLNLKHKGDFWYLPGLDISNWPAGPATLLVRDTHSHEGWCSEIEIVPDDFLAPATVTKVSDLVSLAKPHELKRNRYSRIREIVRMASVSAQMVMDEIGPHVEVVFVDLGDNPPEGIENRISPNLKIGTPFDYKCTVEPTQSLMSSVIQLVGQKTTYFNRVETGFWTRDLDTLSVFLWIRFLVFDPQSKLFLVEPDVLDVFRVNNLPADSPYGGVVFFEIKDGVADLVLQEIIAGERVSNYREYA